MEKSGFVADPIYGEIKNEIMANTLENGEKVDIEHHETISGQQTSSF